MYFIKTNIYMFQKVPKSLIMFWDWNKINNQDISSLQCKLIEVFFMSEFPIRAIGGIDNCTA